MYSMRSPVELRQNEKPERHRQGGTCSPWDDWMSQALTPSKSNKASTTYDSWLAMHGREWCPLGFQSELRRRLSSYLQMWSVSRCEYKTAPNSMQSTKARKLACVPSRGSQANAPPFHFPSERHHV